MQKTLTGLLLAGILVIVGCGGADPAAPAPADTGLNSLPEDTGGVHLALPRDPDGTDAAPHGCYLYLPAGWEESPVAYPLLIFLHGAGEKGDSHADPDVLDLVLRNGPPRLIHRGEWQPPHPMIVISPQCHTGWWDPDGVRTLLEWVDLHYPVDRSRIYMTGLSRSGFGTWSQLGRYGDQEADPLSVAAAAPICGGGGTGQAAAIATTPIWAFHGTADGTVGPGGSVNLVKAIGALDPAVSPRLTLFEGVGHNSWARTYDGSGLDEGIGSYPTDPAVDSWLVSFAPDLYTWLFSHHR